MGKTMIQGDIVKKYLNKYPQLPSLTLAKLIFQENELLFNSVESVRKTVRYYRGAVGDKQRETVLDKKFIRDHTSPNFAPFKIPDSVSKDAEPYKLPTANNNIGVISDLHIPNHRVEPIKIALNYFDKKQINTLIINGDLLDNTPFTRFNVKRPTAKDAREWFDMAEEFLEHCRDRYPTAKIIWLAGNHDMWYERWMWSHAYQLGDDPYFTLQERLHLTDHKIEWIPENRYLLAGKLSIVHGHHLVKGVFAPVNAARGVYLKAKKSVMIGHVHVTSEHTETDLHGDIITCWSTGCNCTLTPDYSPMGGKACHGFAHVTTERNGDFNVENFRIHKGKLL